MPPRRVPRPRHVDDPNNPAVPEPLPWELGKSSSLKLASEPAIFVPLPETPEPDLEQDLDATKMASDSPRKGMPNRRDPKVLFFDRNRPEELLRYIEDVAKALERAGVSNDQEMKDWLRHYADQRSSDEWTVLNTYPSEGGSFEDFVEELVSHYPERTDSLEGSIMRLDRLCARSTPLTSENLSAMLEFIRGFKFEGRKLLRAGCTSNREIITKFLNCLDPELRKTVTWQIPQKSLNDKRSSTGIEPETKTRHHTDPIDFESLLKVSENLVRSANSYNAITTTGNSGITVRSINLNRMSLPRPMEPAASSDRMVQLLEDLNESMAKITDVLVHMSKENSQRHDETIRSIETIHTLLNSRHKDEAGTRTNQPSLTSIHECYYCWSVGHFVADCQFLAADRAKRKIETHGKGTNVDEKGFPREPSHLSPKDRVDRIWKDRTQFVIENLPEDGIADLMPNGIVTLQSNQNLPNRNQKQFIVENLPEDKIVDLAPNGLVTLQSDRNVRDQQWTNQNQFFMENLPDDGIIDLMPDGIVTLQQPIFSQNVRDKRDNLIAKLQEEAERAAEERDMWKAIIDTGQLNMSVPIAPRVQNAPQSTVS